MRARGSGVVPALLAILAACGGSTPTVATAPSAPPAGTLASPSPAPAPGPSASPSSAPNVIEASFRLRPEPGPDGVVTLDEGTAMIVNAAGSTSSDPSVALRLLVDWGDGASHSIGCGACRLEHVYGGTGRFTLVATLTDGRGALRGATEATRTVTVEVRRPSGPPATPPGRATIVIGNLSTTTPLDNVQVSGPQSHGPFNIQRATSRTLSDVPPGRYRITGARFIDGPTCEAVDLDVTAGQTARVGFQLVSGSSCSVS